MVKAIKVKSGAEVADLNVEDKTLSKNVFYSFVLKLKIKIINGHPTAKITMYFIFLSCQKYLCV